MSKALCDNCLPSRSLGEDLVIHKDFDRFFRVGLDCLAMLAMTHTAKRLPVSREPLTLVAAQGFEPRTYGL